MRLALAACLIVCATAAAAPANAAVASSAEIVASIDDPGRPEADRSRDGARHPAETLAFAGVKTGDRVADLIPGGGYYTRLFSKAVGPAGRVFAVIPDTPAPRAQDLVAMQELAKAYGNVTVVTGPIVAFSPGDKLDVVWTSENYHDLRIPMFGSQDMAAFNRMVFNALNPGGVFYVEDHAAQSGAGEAVAATLHRSDPALVRKEIEAVGFRLEAQTDILANPADPKSALVFDPSIRGKTDKFVMRFRKPR